MAGILPFGAMFIELFFIFSVSILPTFLLGRIPLIPKLLKGRGLPLDQSPIPVFSEGDSWFLPGHSVVSRESYGTLLVV